MRTKHHFLAVFLCSVSLLGFTQEIDMNVENGYVANGYDVVAYFNEVPMKGNDQFIFEYNGFKYKFSSKANLESFKTNPDYYVPQYGGYCAWAIADKGKKVSINPKSFEIRDGKLYLFYHTALVNTLKKWQNADTEALTSKADKHWETIKFKKD